MDPATIIGVERETDAIFRQLTEDLEAEFRSIELQTAHSTPFDVRRGAMTFAVGAAATIAIGVVHPVAGAVAFLCTVVLTGRQGR